MGKLKICVGNICDYIDGKDAVVNISNQHMTSGPFVQQAGWAQFMAYRQKYFPNLMEVNEVRKTPGFSLPCDILHIYFIKKTNMDILKAYIYLYDFILNHQYHNVLIPSFLLPEESMNRDIYQKLVKITDQFCHEHNIDLTLLFSDNDQAKLYQGFQKVLNW